MNILDQIVDSTREKLRKHRADRSTGALEEMPGFADERRDFAASLRASGMSVIAEIKRASPSKGIIRQSFDPDKIAAGYQEAGAAAISVLTEEHHFQGSLDHLAGVRQAVTLPILRKDFVIDPYQVVEARAFGADAVLLIAAILDPSQLHELHEAAREYEIAALVEIYDPRELDRLDVDQFEIVGVNNRDLRTFEVDLHRSISVLGELPPQIVRVSESGITSADDLHLLLANGIHAALIGESFMRADRPGEQLQALLEALDRRLQDSPV